MKTKRNLMYRGVVAGVAIALNALSANAAGLLTPVGSAQQPLELESHHVRVVINNGFAKTEVEQVFYNSNPMELEAVYSAPVPKDGALSELTIWAGERVLQGEVVAKEEADRIYQEEKQSGNDVGKADKNAYQDFEFSVYSVPAHGSVRMRYVYYEPLEIDTGVGKYVYPLEEGGTDEAATSFWTMNDVVMTDFSVEVELKSAHPVAKTRVPHYGGEAVESESGSLRYRYESQGAILDQDFVFYYMLEEGLPGRLEMMTYRENEDKPGTFMMVMTPGVDLEPLKGGADYVFVLDVSGSMQGKLATLVAGVKKSLGQMRSEDRFRIVLFNNAAWDVNRGWLSATEANVRETLARLDQLGSNGGTNLYAGIRMGLERLDADRVTSLILVTDGVANQGIVDPKAFYQLMERQDVRFFGFLLGNSSNWPLLQLICEASGGSYRSVSNADDIIGEVLIAKHKITHEAMRNASIGIDGVNTHDVGNFRIGKIHYGDQLVLFGRYEQGGKARVSLNARVNGEDRVYSTEVAFPDIDGSHPELERMWALDQVSKIEINEMAGFLPAAEAEDAIRDIGVAYQIVTDETSMIALDDAGFERHGLERRNRDRIGREQAAQVAFPNRSGAQRVDTNQPMYQRSAPSMGGGGAVGHWFFGGIVALGLALGFARASRRGRGAAGALALAGLLAMGSNEVEAEGAHGYRWTDRVDTRVEADGSIDASIARFWGVSEAEARVERSSSRQDGSRESDFSPQPRAVSQPNESADSHDLDQRRAKGSRRGHFGLNLFNAIPVIDLVWGEEHVEETDAYRGSVRR